MAVGKEKKIYNIILEKQVKEEIDELARIEDRSSSNLINRILKKYIADNEIVSRPVAFFLEDKKSKSEN